MAAAYRLPHQPRSSARTDLTVRELLHRAADPDGDTFERAIANIEAARVRKLVQALPVLECHVVTWYYGLDGAELSLRAIADRLGIGRSAARSIHDRALDLLRDRYGRDLAAA